VSEVDEKKASSAPETLAKGRYSLIETIGEGGIATVWRATDRVLGVDRAIKLLDETAGRYPAFRSRFHTEARTMARIEHPTVMRVYDYGAEGGRYYLVMELIEGGSVKDLLVAGERITPSRALRIAFDVCNALTAVHAMGAVHRDVKPGNLLLASDGSARLSDFGIVRLLDAKPLHETRSDDRLGTVGYMAPEQGEDPTQVGPRADLYAVGATLYAMVTGRHPSVLAALTKRPELLANVPEDIARVIKTSTASNPESRYPDARSMAADIAKAFDVVEQKQVGDSWMLSLDQSLDTCLTRWGRKSSTDQGMAEFVPSSTPAPAGRTEGPRSNPPSVPPGRPRRRRRPRWTPTRPPARPHRRTRRRRRGRCRRSRRSARARRRRRWCSRSRSAPPSPDRSCGWPRWRSG
jgi:serine/threonine protein kinase